MHRGFVAWITFGGLAAAWVIAQVGILPRYRQLQVVFYFLIVLLGPLNLLVVLISEQKLKEYSRAVRYHLDRRQDEEDAKRIERKHDDQVWNG